MRKRPRRRNKDPDLHAAFAFDPAASISAMKASSIVGSGVLRSAQPRFHSLRRAFGEKAALRHDHKAIAILRFLHEMGGHEHGDAGIRQGVDAPPELAPRQRIDAGGWLVEKQNFGLVHQGAGERQALFEAKRQIAACRVREGAEAELTEPPVDAGALAGAVQLIGAAEEPQILAHREIAIERKFLRHVANAATRRRGGSPKIETGDPQDAL